MWHCRALAPSLLLLPDELLLLRLGILVLLVLLLALGIRSGATHVHMVLRGRAHLMLLLLATVHMLLVARIRLYVVQLLIDQVELRGVVVDVVLDVDGVLTVVDQVATFITRKLILVRHVRSVGLPA